MGDQQVSRLDPLDHHELLGGGRHLYLHGVGLLLNVLLGPRDHGGDRSVDDRSRGVVFKRGSDLKGESQHCLLGVHGRRGDPAPAHRNPPVVGDVLVALEDPHFCRGGVEAAVEVVDEAHDLGLVALYDVGQRLLHLERDSLARQRCGKGRVRDRLARHRRHRLHGVVDRVVGDGRVAFGIDGAKRGAALFALPAQLRPSALHKGHEVGTRAVVARPVDGAEKALGQIVAGEPRVLPHVHVIGKSRDELYGLAGEGAAGPLVEVAQPEEDASLERPARVAQSHLETVGYGDADAHLGGIPRPPRHGNEGPGLPVERAARHARRPQKRRQSAGHLRAFVAPGHIHGQGHVKRAAVQGGARLAVDEPDSILHGFGRALRRIGCVVHVIAHSTVGLLSRLDRR